MRRSILKTGLVASVLLAGLPGISQAGSLEDLLVEKGVITKGEASGMKASGPAKVYWNRGTRIDFPDNGFTFGFNTLFQSRYSFIDSDLSDNVSTFDVVSARLMANGTALNEEFAYKVEGDLVGESVDGERTPTLKDAYLAWSPCGWTLKMGQFKTLVSRQYANSEYALQFADRSVATDFFNLGRQAGLHGSTSLMDGQIELGAGIFNGESDGEGTNRSGVDTNHTGIVDVRWNAMGKMNIKEEGDVDYTEDAALSLGARYAYSDYQTGDDLMDVGGDTIGVDVNFKSQGFSFHGEFFNANVDPDVGEDQDSSGFYAQAGYFLDPKTWEVAARYSMVDCDNGSAWGDCSGNDQISEWAATINHYWWAHYLKAQLGYFHTTTEPVSGEDIEDNRWVFQLSSYL